MTPQYQLNFSQPDPLLSIGNFQPNSYVENIENEMKRLNSMKEQFVKFQNTIPNGNNVQENIWDKVDMEISAMTNEQLNILREDETYISIETELNLMVQQELINSVKDKIANSPRGKELLEKHLSNIKEKKNKIIEAANKEIELFKKFQIAVQANPNLTYPEFIKSIK